MVSWELRTTTPEGPPVPQLHDPLTPELTPDEEVDFEEWEKELEDLPVPVPA